MLSIIKRSIKYFIIVIGIIIALPTVFAFVLRIPEVQTLIVRRITSYFSKEIQSVISVGNIQYSFFNKLNINDILIKDKNSDTLIYAQSITAGIRRFNVKDKIISLGRVAVIKPYFALITDSTGLLNLNWYLDLLRSPEDTTMTKTKTTFSINQIDLSNGRFALMNEKGGESKIPVNFNDLHLNNINAIVEDFRIINDSTLFSVYNLGFRESSGFTVKKMNSEVSISKNDIAFKSASLLCDTSALNISHLVLHSDSSDGFRNFIREVKLDILLDRSMVSSSDLRYFISPVKDIDESVWLTGKVTGTVSELRGRNILLSAMDSTQIDCDFDFSGLPEFRNTFIYLRINSLKTSSGDLARIKIPGRDDFRMPDIITKLGNISFDGNFTGFITDFVTYGELKTNIGTLNTDVSMRPEEENRFKIKGLLTGSSINLGAVTNRPDLLGNISMSTDIDGYSYALKNFSGNLTGKIDSIELNNYKYRNIELNGLFKEDTWDGSVRIADKNIKLDLMGMLNFSREMPEFDFTLNMADANLHELNFDKTDTSATLSMLMTANFKGNNIDNLDGEIKLINSNIRRNSRDLDLYDMSLRTFKEGVLPAMSLRTDFVDADLRGNYNFADLISDIKSVQASLMPSKFSGPLQKNRSGENNFKFNITFKNTDKISKFFNTGIQLSEKSIINGTVFPDSIIIISGRADSLNVRNLQLKDLLVDSKVSLPDFTFNLKTRSLSLLGQSELKNFSVDLKTVPDNFVFKVNWDNKEEQLNNGNFIARGNFLPDKSGKLHPILTINIDSTNIYSQNNLWKINNSSILLDSNAIKINKLYISSKDRFYLIDGKISEDPADTLDLEFKGIDISPLNYLITKGNTPGAFSLFLKGRLDGTLFLTDVYRNILLESDLKVNDFSILGSELGDLSVLSVWDNRKKVANISASNNLNGMKMLNIAGYYDPASKYINLSAGTNKLPVNALNPLLNSFASGITGTASGRVYLTGEVNKPVLKGALMAENVLMKIDYLQTIYRLNDSIRFDRNEIRFGNIRIYDEKGNVATLTGSVNHKYFNDFRADIMVTTNDNMVLNTKPKDNQMFYGTAYATGVTTIKSTPNLVSFDISAKTGRNTRFYMPLTYTETVSDYSYITFINPDTAGQAAKNTGKKPAGPVSTTGLDINFDLEVTPEAELQLIFDSKIGDIIKSHGSGNLNIHLDRKGTLSISGDYIIEDGNYLFTLGNVFNKPFVVERGGTIRFNGNVDNAEINLKAIYTVRASLNEILPELNNPERIPVECQLILSGKLLNPVVGFNIYLPSADEETRTYLSNVLSSEEELSRQFLYLLVMNSFYPDPTYRKPSTSIAGTSAMAVTTTEMLSNQLSNWLSQISKDFDIGFLYRPPGYYQNPVNKDLINSEEVEVALSTQLLNDRVVINGNVDVRGRGNTNNADQVTGDFDIEYRITENIRFKFFNRFNNPYAGRGDTYTQGFGLFFKHDFNKFSDLFRRREKSAMKKEDNPTSAEN